MAMVAPSTTWTSRDTAISLNNHLKNNNSKLASSNLPSNQLQSSLSQDITCINDSDCLITERDSSELNSQIHSSQSVNSQTDKLSNIECVVCGDKSSGKHYGQFTCEGNPLYFFSIFLNSNGFKLIFCFVRLRSTI